MMLLSPYRMMFIAVLLGLVLAVCVKLFIISGNQEKEKIRMQQQTIDAEASSRVIFKDWVKYTGNPNHLTYDEWVSLKNAKLLNKHSK